MSEEAVFLAHSFILGLYITFVYDLLRIFRRVVRHGWFWMSAEDFVYWVYCAGEFFLLLYHESNGIIRWYAVLGTFSGMFLYHRLLSPFLVETAAGLLNRILGFARKTAGFLLRPVKRAAVRLEQKAKRAAKRHAVKCLKRRETGRSFLKKQLTKWGKAHRMDT